MSGGIIDRIKNWNSTKPNEIMQAFASDLHEIVERMEIAELSVAERDTLLAVVAEQARQIEAARELIAQLAPDEPMNQDEQGGCVWCSGKPHGRPYGYATSNPKHHSVDCPWIIARAWLAANAPTPTQGETEGDPKFNSVQEYRNALEKIESVWVGESVTDEHIAALKMYTIAARALNNADDETESEHD